MAMPISDIIPFTAVRVTVRVVTAMIVKFF